MVTLPAAPTEHDCSQAASPPTTPPATPATKVLGGAGLDPKAQPIKGRTLQRLPTDRVAQLDGGSTLGDAMRWSITVQPLTGFIQNASFDSKAFEVACYDILQASNIHFKPKFTVQHNSIHKCATSWTADIKQAVAVEVDVVATSNIVQLLQQRVSSVHIVAIEEADEMSPEMEQAILRASRKQSEMLHGAEVEENNDENQDAPESETVEENLLAHTPLVSPPSKPRKDHQTTLSGDGLHMEV